MPGHQSRRRFLQTAAAGTAAFGLGDLAFLGQLPRVSAEEARLNPDLVRLQPDIEPLVRLLEVTPRARLLEEIGSRIRGGLPYRDVLAALLLAGVRNVQPRPNVGFKFHAVLVVNSAHLASLASPDSDRWLPIFWALDYFKESQATTQRESGWRMEGVNEAGLPPAHKAREQFTAAMDNWDEPAADAAIAVLARTAGSNELFEMFCRYGARDFRSIGHKAIYVANAWRTLDCIGWQHAEPVLRSLAYALLYHEGDNPAKRDADADRPGRRNLELAKRIRGEWQEGKLDSEATVEMVAALREASPDQACDLAVALLNKGVAPQSITDACFLTSGELIMRQPGIVALHTATTTNALHYAYKVSGQDETRRWLLLQNVAFLPMFRQTMAGRGKLQDHRIDKLAAPDANDGAKDAVPAIFSQVGKERLQAAEQTLGYLQRQGDVNQLMNAARRLVFLKGNDSHDYKFSSAVLEDYGHVSAGWRNRYLAAGTFQLRGSGGPDNTLVQRTRAALGVG